MATVQTIINRALRLLGQLPAGQDPETDESDDALEVLNELIDDWQNDKLLTYSRQEESLTLSSADGSYTIGVSGDLVTTRPDDIEAAWIVEGDISYPVILLNDQEYAAIVAKASDGDWPEYANYKPSFPDGTLTVYPVPNGTRTMKLLTRVPLVEFTATTDTISLPPGFRKAFAANLAVALAPEYDMNAPLNVMKMASESKAGLKRINARPIKVHTELNQLLGRRTGNILADGA